MMSYRKRLGGVTFKNGSDESHLFTEWFSWVDGSHLFTTRFIWVSFIYER